MVVATGFVTIYAAGMNAAGAPNGFGQCRVSQEESWETYLQDGLPSLSYSPAGANDKFGYRTLWEEEEEKV